jgi:hypothetical protein
MHTSSCTPAVAVKQASEPWTIAKFVEVLADQSLAI